MTSSLAEDCDNALAKTAEEMTPADLCLLISQDAELERVIPQAIRVLDANPLIMAQFFRGDLLARLVRVRADYWSAHEREWIALHKIVHEIEQAVAVLNDKNLDFFKLK